MSMNEEAIQNNLFNDLGENNKRGGNDNARNTPTKKHQPTFSSAPYTNTSFSSTPTMPITASPSLEKQQKNLVNAHDGQPTTLTEDELEKAKKEKKVITANAWRLRQTNTFS